MPSSRRPAALTLLVAFPFSLALSACAGKPGDAAPGSVGAAAPGASSGAAPVATLAAATTPGTATPATTPAASAAAPVTSDFDAKFFESAEPKTTATGIQYVDVVPGTGAELGPGKVGVLDFTGWLGNGVEFDSSKQRAGDFCFEVGGARSIAFFNEGMTGMKVGGTRRFRVLPEQGYGATGRPPIIPPNSTLLFEMKLRDVRESAKKPDVASLKLNTTPSGLKWADLEPGSGEAVKEGGSAKVLYSGFLEDGTKFDSSVDRCSPFDVAPVGKAQVIAGWNEGLQGMKAGGRRVLVIPGNLAYGESGRPPVIPPGATLVFDIQALEVAPPPKPPEPMNFPDIKTTKLTTNPSGLQWADVKAGSGKEIVKGGTATMHYTGWLENGTKFDSSLDSGNTFDVVNVGQAGVIAGWNEGLQGMKEGGRRILVIPGSLAYGERGYPGAIPPNATLIFMIDAVKVK